MNHSTDNPFQKPEDYPALLYKTESSPDTLLDVHRKIISPDPVEDLNMNSDL